MCTDEDDWWLEDIGGGWSMKSFTCQGGRYFLDFLSRRVDLIRDLMSFTKYDLSKITSRGLNLFGVKDATHPGDFHTRMRVPVRDLVRTQFEAMMVKIEQWSSLSHNKHILPDYYIDNLKRLGEHFKICDHYNDEGTYCLQCSKLRDAVRDGFLPYDIASGLEQSSDSVRVEVKPNRNLDEVSLFFPLLDILKPIWKEFLIKIRNKNQLSKLVITYDMDSSTIRVSDTDVNLKCVYIIVYDDGNSLYSIEKLRDCSCGDIIKFSPFQHCGKFYIGSRIEGQWNWVDYFAQNKLPKKVREMLPRCEWEENRALQNGYIFAMQVYDHKVE